MPSIDWKPRLQQQAVGLDGVLVAAGNDHAAAQRPRYQQVHQVEARLGIEDPARQVGLFAGRVRAQRAAEKVRQLGFLDRHGPDFAQVVYRPGAALVVAQDEARPRGLCFQALVFHRADLHLLAPQHARHDHHGQRDDEQRCNDGRAALAPGLRMTLRQSTGASRHVKAPSCRCA
jgi:hypothetical protein